jgi:hypothetical protein
MEEGSKREGSKNHVSSVDKPASLPVSKRDIEAIRTFNSLLRIFPGGESETMSLYICRYRNRYRSIWGTGGLNACALLVLSQHGR